MRSPRYHLDDHPGSHVSGEQLTHSTEYTLPENDHPAYPREAIPSSLRLLKAPTGVHPCVYCSSRALSGYRRNGCLAYCMTIASAWTGAWAQDICSFNLCNAMRCRWIVHVFAGICPPLADSTY